MLQHLARRLLQSIPVIIGVIVITFTLGYFGPGDPLQYQIGERLPPDPEQLARLRHIYGLDRPYPVQLSDYLVKLVQGDMGRSLVVNRQRPVKDMLGNGLRISLQLGLAAAFLITVIGIPLGVLAAYKQNSPVDYVVVGLTALLPTVPVFVLGPLLLILFVLVLKILPHSYGWKGLFDSRAILPLLVLVIGPLLIVVRQTRSAVLEVLSQEYARTARAKGLTELQVLWRHVLKNALPPVVTSLGFIVASLLTGALFVESIFGIPGFGSLFYESLRAYDYPVLLGVTLISALIIMASNFVVDILYGVLDPRVRQE